MRGVSFLIVLLMSFSLSGCAGQYGINMNQISAEITEYGIFTHSKVSGHTLENLQHQETTTEIPLQKGLSFGLEFKLIGCPANYKLPIKTVYTHPKIQGETQEVLRAEERCGKKHFNTWTIEHDYEMVEGEYLIQIFYRDKLLTEKNFTVSKP